MNEVSEVMRTCSSGTLSNVLSIIKRLMTIIQIVVPILLLVFATISFIKLMQNPDTKNGNKKIINQFIAAIIVFFLPVIVNVTMNLLGESTDISTCWNEASEIISINKSYQNSYEKDRKPITYDATNYEKGSKAISLDYSNSKEISSYALRNASHSDPSIVIVDDEGKVLASRKPDIRREGGSTTKVFAGYAAVKLLDPERDTVTGTHYAIDSCGVFNSNPQGVGQKFSVAKAATYAFPDSSNSTATNIAVAIGRKYYNCSSDKDAFNKGMVKINEFYDTLDLVDTHLGNSNGLDFFPAGHNEFYKNGMPKPGCEDGHTANDLAVVTIDAMKDDYFASGINSRNNNGLFFIKSGTGWQCHGIWGFNHNGKRYYISMLGITCNKSAGIPDNKYTVVKDLYNWTISSLI